MELKDDACGIWLKQAQAKLDSRLSRERALFYLTALTSLIGIGAWIYWEYVVLRSDILQKDISLYTRLFHVAGYVKLVIPAALLLNYFYGFIRVGTFFSDVWGKNFQERNKYSILSGEVGDSFMAALFFGLWIIAALVNSYILGIIICAIGFALVVYVGYLLRHISEDVVNAAGKWDEHLQSMTSMGE